MYVTNASCTGKKNIKYIPALDLGTVWSKFNKLDSVLIYASNDGLPDETALTSADNDFFMLEKSYALESKEMNKWKS